VGCGQRNRRDL